MSTLLEISYALSIKCRFSQVRSTILHHRHQVSDCTGRVSDCTGRVSDCTGQVSDCTGRVSDCPDQVSDCIGQVSDSTGRFSDYLNWALAATPSLENCLRNASPPWFADEEKKEDGDQDEYPNGDSNDDTDATNAWIGCVGGRAGCVGSETGCVGGRREAARPLKGCCPGVQDGYVIQTFVDTCYTCYRQSAQKMRKMIICPLTITDDGAHLSTGAFPLMIGCTHCQVRALSTATSTTLTSPDPPQQMIMEKPSEAVRVQYDKSFKHMDF
ncbi:hypothetical protein BC938DRAFT_480441 [Jimgerdemannia flammicorona]|uniref:Uncharacterized protein n=1 Tax=Jimgerdemannia flammicorona TaxID=994334 RepID=A0A433QIJ9_9FUNG|nr:hypothetical protein BC938DRAFT_480441 [Jimgerdemannia flammicorona]